MHSRGLEYFRQSWNTFEWSQKGFYSVGMLTTGMKLYL
jgi:hypothetical protein